MGNTSRREWEAGYQCIVECSLAPGIHTNVFLDKGDSPKTLWHDSVAASHFQLLWFAIGRGASKKPHFCTIKKNVAMYKAWTSVLACLGSNLVLQRLKIRGWMVRNIIDNYDQFSHAFFFNIFVEIPLPPLKVRKNHLFPFLFSHPKNTQAKWVKG